ncbi:MAG: hypothetical protein ACLP8S_16070 [Solirubrobacteraceae bacterium]
MTLAAGALEDDSPDAPHETREWLTYVVRFDPTNQARPKGCHGQPAPMPLDRPGGRASASAGFRAPGAGRRVACMFRRARAVHVLGLWR